MALQRKEKEGLILGKIAFIGKRSSHQGRKQSLKRVDYCYIIIFDPLAAHMDHNKHA